MFVPVNVQSVDPRFQVVELGAARGPRHARPDQDANRDPGQRRSQGPTPSGLDVRPAVVTPETVSVTGPASIVDQVAAVQANVAIDATGLDIDRTSS